MKQDQNAVHNAHDQMGRFRKLPDRGDMAGFDGLVNNVREAVKHTRELIKKRFA